MTKKDFELIAHVLHSHMERSTPHERVRVALIADTFAASLANTNPRFKRDVFLRACGVES